MSGKKDLLEEDLFGDLNIADASPQAATPPPALADLDTQGASRVDIAEPVSVKPRSIKTTTQALKQPPGRDLTGLWIALAIVLIVGGGGTVGALYFMGMGPFAREPGKQTAVVPMRRRGSTRKKHKKLEIQLSSKPKGASLSINGKKVNIKTPYTLKVVSGRKYELTLTHPGCQPYKKTIDSAKIKESIVELSANLKCAKAPRKPPPIRGEAGVLFLECLPVGASINVALYDRGKCTGKAIRIELEGGTHPMLIQKDGYETSKDPVTVTPGDLVMKKISLKKSDKPSARPPSRRSSVRNAPSRRRKVRRRRLRGKGTVVLKCSPNADVYLRGDKIGKTPLTKSFPAGTRRFVLKNRRLGALKVVKVYVKPKKTITKSVSFGKGTLKFIVKPWGEVYLNGRHIGQAPFPPKKVYEGYHRVELRMKKRKKVFRIRVRAGETTPVIHIFQ